MPGQRNTIGRFLFAMHSPSFPSFRGFGILPNKHFRRGRPQPNRAKIRKCGYTSYACYVSFSTTITVETVKLPNVPNKKENAANNQVCDVHKEYIKQKRGFLFSRFLCVFQAFCCSFHYDIVPFVQPVKLCVELAAARGFFAFFIWKKELVYRDMKKRH